MDSTDLRYAPQEFSPDWAVPPGRMILRELEDGTTTLEDALARYERGVALLRQCYGQLRDAEQRVKVLAVVTEDGHTDLKTFDHVASIETAKAAVRKPGNT